VSQTTLLDVQHLDAFYGRVQVLYDLSFTVQEGEIVSILGANGAGKTSLLRALSGLVRVRGAVTFDGQRVEGKKPHVTARAGIAHVPEGRGTFGGLTVDENLRVAGFSAAAAQSKAALEQVYAYFAPLARLRGRVAGGLSGGEQQMLAIGRALMMRPRLLLLDEPSQGLAPQITESIFSILQQLNQAERVSMLLVEQNASLALRLATSASVLETGRIVLSGHSTVLRNNDDVRKAYLGY
jgi:branched-chain amino acid transport system ATP-binding protein